MAGLNNRLTTLPVELLLAVASHLGLRDVLKFRLIFPKSQEEKVFEILKTALKDTPLHVSPTDASLRSFNEVCANPLLGRVIRHVIFVARALGALQDRGDYLDEEFKPQWVKTFADYKLLGWGDRTYRTKRSYQVYKRFIREHSIDYLSIWKGGETVIDGTVQDALVQGLSQLSLLDTVSITICSSPVEAFNRSTLYYYPYADLTDEEEEAVEKTVYEQEIEAARQTASEYVTTEQIGAMLLALNHIDNKVTRLKLGKWNAP